MGILSNVFGGGNINNLDSNSFAERIKSDPNAVVLDVRTLEEYREVRIPNSILIDFYKEDFFEKLEDLEREKSYYVYCRSGNRSYHAAVEMKNLGFENVYNLANGIISWKGEIEKE